MKRVLRALNDGCTLEGKDGKYLDLDKSKPKELSEEEWKNYCDDVRKKIGAGSVHYRQVKDDPRTEVRAKVAAPAPDANAQAESAAKAQADAQAKAKAQADAKAAADAKAK